MRSNDHSPFEIIYGFNPLTLLDLLPLFIDEMVFLDENKRAKMVKKLYESVVTNRKEK
jgi:hypothetical protein